MASVRSNLNSVPNCTYNLTAVKEHWNTCFQRWRYNTKFQQQRDDLIKGPSQPSSENTKYYTNFAKRTNQHFHNFNAKLKEFFAYTSFLTKRKKKREKFEIVAKLLTATLVATQTTQVQQTTTTTTVETMTIHDSTFLEVRGEYPDIDSEVKSILMARAQNGATISIIKEDYLKLTGMHFPVFKNIVDFLLSIPSVSAVCSDHGTLIFNVVPNDKTKHLYELVLQQKHERNQRSSWGSHTSHRFSSYGGNGFNGNSTKYSWRNRQPLRGNRLSFGKNMVAGPPSKPDCNNTKTDGNLARQSGRNEPIGREAHPLPTTTTVMYKEIEPVPLNLCQGGSEKSQSQTDSEGFVENNYIYQDNCNYLFNRLCNQRNDMPPLHFANIPQRDSNINLAEDPNNLDANYQQPTQYQDVLFVHCTPGELMPPPPPTAPPSSISHPFRNATTSSPIRSVLTSTDSLFDGGSDYSAHILDFQLLGDDFFLYMARMELGCKFKKNQKVLQSGLCISGQTIRDASRNIQRMDNSNRSIIVNIGSVDIMQGRHLVQIEHDFRQLINAMERKGWRPVLTTLAPLANYGHDKQMKEKIERFNGYIRRMQTAYPVIDIWSCMVNESTQTHFDCYQKEPRIVTGAKDPYVFWNKVGRQRVLHMIVSSIEY